MKGCANPGSVQIRSSEIIHGMRLLDNQLRFLRKRSLQNQEEEGFIEGHVIIGLSVCKLKLNSTKDTLLSRHISFVHTLSSMSPLLTVVSE